MLSYEKFFFCDEGRQENRQGWKNREIPYIVYFWKNSYKMWDFVDNMIIYGKMPPFPKKGIAV